MAAKSALILVLLVNQVVSQRWSTPIVVDFFKSKGIHLIDCYLCSDKDAVRLMSETKHDLNDDHAIFWRVLKNWTTETTSERRIGVFFDVSCLQNEELLKASKKMWYNLVISWLIWDPSNATIGRTNLTENLSLFSDVVVAAGGDLKQITKFVSQDPVKVYKIGEWHENGKVDVQHPSIQPNLHRNVIRGAYHEAQAIYTESNVSAQMQDYQFYPGLDSGNRYFYALGVLIADVYNFSLGLTKSSHWGAHLPNGSWTGIMGMLERHEVDVAFNPMIPLPERLEYAYASPCMQPYRFVLIFKQPLVLGTYKAQTMELSGTVWAMAALSLLAGAIVFTLTMKYTELPSATIGLGIVQNIGMVANQGLSESPNSTPSRIVCLTSMTAAFLLWNYYNVYTLKALLTEAPPTIKDLNDFIKSDIKLSLINASYSARPERHKTFFPSLIRRLDEIKPDFLNLDAGLNAIRKGDAFYGESFLLFDAIIKNFTDDEKCSLTVFSSYLDFTAMRFVRQDKHLLEMITRGLTKLQERGIAIKERDFWIAGPPPCFRSVSFIEVQLEAVSVALGIFLAGVVMSAVVFVAEIFRGRKRRNRNETRCSALKVGVVMPKRVAEKTSKAYKRKNKKNVKAPSANWLN